MIDTAENYDGSPQTTVPVGKEVSFKLAYSVVDLADIVMDVQPDVISYDAAIFTT